MHTKMQAKSLHLVLPTEQKEVMFRTLMETFC